MDEYKQRFLFIRTYKHLGAGGSVPPLGLLYIASSIRKAFGNQYELKIIDTGMGNLTLEEVRDELVQFRPQFVGLSSLSCEAELMHKIAMLAKKVNRNSVVLAGGPHATIAKEHLLEDENIDYAVIGEGEAAIVELLKALETSRLPSAVDGIAYRQNNGVFLTKPRDYIEALDKIPFPAWDLIDIKEYAKYPNWNGTIKEKFYIPILTSRGCPYQCTYCHNIFGKRVRIRSPENVLSEIMFLYQNYHAKEIHIVDDIFNFDLNRVKRLCSLIINSGIKFSFAFPNGLRADGMSEELISLLKKIGTYKINYGFETITPRLQQMIKKNLNISRAIDIVNKTVKTGIITAGYFMLGFPTETRQEMLQTIDFAVKSNLDIAYFFKVTPYPGTELYQSLPELVSQKFPENFNDFHFYSVERCYAEIPVSELNDLVLEAQQRFFLNPKRLCRGLLKSSHKLVFLKNLVNAVMLIVQSYLLKILTKSLSN